MKPKCSKEFSVTILSGPWPDITPPITSGDGACFTDVVDAPAGTYQVEYLEGALNYSDNLALWNVNNILATGYHILYRDSPGHNHSAYFSELTTGAFASQALAEAANAGATHTFVHAGGGNICVFFVDAPYTDNHPGSPNPTFRLTKIA